MTLSAHIRNPSAAGDPVARRRGCYNWCRMAQSPARVSTSQPSGARVAGTAGAPRTAYAVLAAVSLSHLLNDTIQSLLPAIYPHPQSIVRLELLADRADDAGADADRVGAAAGRRADHRSASGAVRAGRRHELHARRSVAAVGRLDLPAAARWPLRSSASAPRSSILNRRASRGWRPADSTASRNRSFRSAATPGRRSVRCSRRSSSRRTVSEASSGARWSPSPASS